MAPPDSIASGSATLVIAVPLDDVHSTVQRLTMIELLVGAIALVAVGVLALILVRVGLRPLGRIEQTAGAIAAGDLSQRVENSDPRTEVGRLGGALNEMLAQIERAFAERERSENRLRRFVADASHELRTPLTSVRGYAELFRRGASDRPEDLRVVMRRIEDEAARMGVLVEDMLLLARLDQGRPLEREPVDLGAIAADLADDARMLHPDWPVELRVDGETIVTGDELRLRQALGNLLANARAHTPAGHPRHRRRDRQRAGRDRRGGRPTAPASPPRTCPACSSGSTAPTPRDRAPAAAADSGCRSWHRSPRPTAARPP